MTRIPYRITRSAIGFLTRNPSSTTGVLVFGLAFSLVAGNALYSQSGSHPDPLWKTRDMMLTRSVPVTSKPVLLAHPVLTQKISVKNIPVPTASPVRRTLPSAHSSIVRDVQSALAGIGYYGGKIDGIYGSATREAIIAYQDSAGILPDGEASFGLLSNLKSALAVSKSKKTVVAKASQPGLKDSTQQASASTAIVAKIQKGLSEFGFDEVNVDGVMGSQTRRAIRKFQTRFDLNVTGEPDNNTLEKLVQIGVLTNI